MATRPVRSTRTVTDYSALHTGKPSPGKRVEVGVGKTNKIKDKRKLKTPRKVIGKKGGKDKLVEVLRSSNGHWSVTPLRGGTDGGSHGASPVLTDHEGVDALINQVVSKRNKKLRDKGKVTVNNINNCVTVTDYDSEVVELNTGEEQLDDMEESAEVAN